MILVLALFGCSFPQAQPPRRAGAGLVSLNPCTDALLAELADPAQVLALSHYSHDPGATSMDMDQARRYHITGGTAEEVLALRPDLVVAGTFTPQATQQAFRRLGIPLEPFGVAGSVAESVAQVRRMAALVGHADRGEELVLRIERALADARPDKGAQLPETLVWQEGGIIAGGGSLIAELLARTGFANHSAARGLGQGAYLPLEQVLADPPQLILAAGDARALSHPALSRLADTQYETFDPALLYCGGPTIIRAVQRLADIRRAAGR